MDWIDLVDDGFSQTPEFRQVQADVVAAVQTIHWPPDSDDFIINPTRQGNGVKPIKDAFVEYLEGEGWVAEYRRFDAHYTFPDGAALPFAVEWETGNISSSHRAINRMALAMLNDEISGGVLVLPTRAMYRFLTDRVGNVDELEPYFDLYRLWQGQTGFRYLAVVAVEHDGEDERVPLIRKGTDGRALV